MREREQRARSSRIHKQTHGHVCGCVSGCSMEECECMCEHEKGRCSCKARVYVNGSERDERASEGTKERKAHTDGRERASSGCV